MFLRHIYKYLKCCQRMYKMFLTTLSHCKSTYYIKWALSVNIEDNMIGHVKINLIKDILNVYVQDVLCL